jgi:hypothetical protein
LQIFGELFVALGGHDGQRIDFRNIPQGADGGIKLVGSPVN